MKKKCAKLSVVIPFFNEEKVVDACLKTFERLSFKHKGQYIIEIIAVDDGSADKTFEILKTHAAFNKKIKVISFSRNFGHQQAITAGLESASGDFIGIIDADLQDPPDVLIKMLAKAQSGYDVVYGKRIAREGESLFKKTTAILFYKLMSCLCDFSIPENVGDFRVVNRRVANELLKMKEKHRFFRGMVAWVGFRSFAFSYKRAPRFAGETKYPFRKMLRFALNAIFSFSSKPLTIGVKLGFVMIGLSLVGSAVMIALKLFTNLPVPGLTAILLTITLLSGTQTLLIGLVGEYIARIFEEIKNRQLYIIQNKINI